MLAKRGQRLSVDIPGDGRMAHAQAEAADLVRFRPRPRLVVGPSNGCLGPRPGLLLSRGGEGGRGFWTQNLVYQKWPDQIFPIVNFVFSDYGHFGLGRGGGGFGGGSPPPWFLIILKKPWPRLRLPFSRGWGALVRPRGKGRHPLRPFHRVASPCLWSRSRGCTRIAGAYFIAMAHGKGRVGQPHV